LNMIHARKIPTTDIAAALAAGSFGGC
jgi:hypothetical protein